MGQLGMLAVKRHHHIMALLTHAFSLPAWTRGDLDCTPKIGQKPTIELHLSCHIISQPRGIQWQHSTPTYFPGACCQSQSRQQPHIDKSVISDHSSL